MPNYVNILAEYYPDIPYYCVGDPTVYGNIVFLGSPIISQGTLDALTISPLVYPVEVAADTLTNLDILQYNSSNNHWENKSLAEAGISATGHSHNKSDISDFTESDYVHTTGVETIGGNKTFSNNVTITGDLSVDGTTTSINTTTLEIGDNIYLLNADMDDGSPIPSPTQDAGFEVERGTATNVSWLWDETLDTFRPKLGAGEAALGYILDPTDANGVGDRGYNDLRYAPLSHTHVMVDITDSTWISDITGELLSDLNDTTISSIGANEILKWNGSAWINNTLAEAGISATGHTHVMANITDSTWISDITSENLEDLSNITITSLGTDELLFTQDGSTWINQTLAEAGISATGHTHVMANITDSTWISDITGEDLTDLNDVTITSLGTDELLFTQDGSTWINQTLAEAGIATSGHTHALNDLTDVTIGSPTPTTDDILTFNGSTWQAAPIDSSAMGHYKQLVYGAISKSSGTSSIPDDDTIPTSSEGYEIWSDTITPGSTDAVIKIGFSITIDTYVSGGMGGGDMDVAVTVFRDSTCIGAMSQYIDSYNQEQMSINIVDAPSTTSSITYSARIGRLTSSGTWYVNRLQSEKLGGMLEKQGYTIEEID